MLVDGFHVGFKRRDDSGDQLFPNRVVHELHALTLARDNDVLKLLGCSFADDCGDGAV